MFFKGKSCFILYICMQLIIIDLYVLNFIDKQGTGSMVPMTCSHILGLCSFHHNSSFFLIRYNRRSIDSHLWLDCVQQHFFSKANVASLYRLGPLGPHPLSNKWIMRVVVFQSGISCFCWYEDHREVNGETAVPVEFRSSPALLICLFIYLWERSCKAFALKKWR